MLVVALAFAVLEIGGSASEVGLVLAAGTLLLALPDTRRLRRLIRD